MLLLQKEEKKLLGSMQKEFSELFESLSSSQKMIVVPLWILAVIAIMIVLKLGANLFIFLTCSFLLFALLDPWLVRMGKKGISSTLSSAFLITIATSIIVAIISSLLYFSSDIYDEINESKNVIKKYYQSFDKNVKEISKQVTPAIPVAPTIDTTSGKPIAKVEVVETSPLKTGIIGQFVNKLGGFLEIIAFIFLWPIMTFFLLAERPILARIAHFAFRNPKRGDEMWEKIVTLVNAFFIGNLILILITFPVFGLVFQLFGIKSVFAVAIIASLLNALPFIGGVVTGIIPALLTLTTTNNPFTAFWVYTTCVVIHFIFANFATPKILGSKVNLNASTATVAMLVWAALWGPGGLLLAIPVTGIMRILLAHARDPWLSFIAGLMSENIDPVVKLGIGFSEEQAEILAEIKEKSKTDDQKTDQEST